MVAEDKPEEPTAGSVSPGEPAEDFVGVPDGFQRLWTPHRMAYITGDRPSRDAGSGCPFCAAPDKDDADGLIVHRGETCYVVLNLFPYNPGHLLICPYRHVPLYTDLTAEETVEFATLTQTAMSTLTRASAPEGFNLGMNQGHVAGAGVAAHLHQHVVPRWGGDMNFLPVIGQTKALPILLEDTRQALLAQWPA
ncbi:HIT domain-containing protein [Ornithinimicrobium ciconiae]|uniref:HIT domain-containing protein n=1 Tax=Ornithinimicrobium ciconiae TaxID=2594265 RepID=A0A516GAV5_9MICO|nr:HIT domain-containing protein [Ornithinimicrobium ciconiae]QDO88645.1 HIT domain-containing protein [Ornithinimicrobium ciconiae]